MTFEEMRERIIAINTEQNRLTVEEETLTKRLRERCTHETVIEVEYEKQVFFSSLPPRRMCLVCGLEEDGWGSGYKKLVCEPVKVVSSRDEFYIYRELKPLTTIMVLDNLFDKARA